MPINLMSPMTTKPINSIPSKTINSIPTEPISSVFQMNPMPIIEGSIEKKQSRIYCCMCVMCIIYITVSVLFIVGMIEWESIITQKYLDLNKINTFGQNNLYCNGKYDKSTYEYFVKYDCFKSDIKIKCSDYCINDDDIIEDNPTKPLTNKQLYKCLIIVISDNHNDSITQKVYFDECYANHFNVNDIMSQMDISAEWITTCVIGTLVLLCIYCYCAYTISYLKIYAHMEKDEYNFK